MGFHKTTGTFLGVPIIRIEIGASINIGVSLFRGTTIWGLGLKGGKRNGKQTGKSSLGSGV